MSDKILVIDDSPEIHTLVRVRLAKEPVCIYSAYDGVTGLVAAQDVRPAVILLDVEMPDRNGFSVCSDLKADPVTRDIPIIFLTGSASTEDKIRGLELGATDYVTKPFEPAELRARVRATLRTTHLIELLSQKAMIDGLTGLWNRSYLEAHFNLELSAARRNGQPLSCVMADVDQFKSINDRYGHGFGDDALRSIAETISSCTRAKDVACRYGGEEFTILLPNTTIEEAADFAEKLRARIEATPLYFRDARVAVTCSFGVANLRGQLPPTLIDLADEALFEAKRAGRNRVALSPELQKTEAFPTPASCQ